MNSHEFNTNPKTRMVTEMLIGCSNFKELVKTYGVSKVRHAKIMDLLDQVCAEAGVAWRAAQEDGPDAPQIAQSVWKMKQLLGQAGNLLEEV